MGVSSPLLTIKIEVIDYKNVITKSALESLQQFWNSNAWVPLFIVGLFSIVLPLFKFSMNAISIISQLRGCHDVKLFGHDITATLRSISKYQFVDVFVVLLLVSLLNGEVMNSKIEPGFFYFFLYCSLSVASSQIVFIKKQPHGIYSKTISPPPVPSPVRSISLLFFETLQLVVYSVLFIYGIFIAWNFPLLIVKVSHNESIIVDETSTTLRALFHLMVFRSHQIGAAIILSLCIVFPALNILFSWIQLARRLCISLPILFPSQEPSPVNYLSPEMRRSRMERLACLVAVYASEPIQPPSSRSMKIMRFTEVFIRDWCMCDVLGLAVIVVAFAMASFEGARAEIPGSNSGLSNGFFCLLMAGVSAFEVASLHDLDRVAWGAIKAAKLEVGEQSGSEPLLNRLGSNEFIEETGRLASEMITSFEILMETLLKIESDKMATANDQTLQSLLTHLMDIKSKGSHSKFDSHLDDNLSARGTSKIKITNDVEEHATRLTDKHSSEFQNKNYLATNQLLKRDLSARSLCISHAHTLHKNLMQAASEDVLADGVHDQNFTIPGEEDFLANGGLVDATLTSSNHHMTTQTSTLCELSRQSSPPNRLISNMSASSSPLKLIPLSTKSLSTNRSRSATLERGGDRGRGEECKPLGFPLGVSESSPSIHVEQERKKYCKMAEEYRKIGRLEADSSARVLRSASLADSSSLSAPVRSEWRAYFPGAPTMNFQFVGGSERKKESFLHKWNPFYNRMKQNSPVTASNLDTAALTHPFMSSSIERRHREAVAGGLQASISSILQDTREFAKKFFIDRSLSNPLVIAKALLLFALWVMSIWVSFPVIVNLNMVNEQITKLLPDIQNALVTQIPNAFGDCTNKDIQAPEGPCEGKDILYKQKGMGYEIYAHWIQGIRSIKLNSIQAFVQKSNLISVSVTGQLEKVDLLIRGYAAGLKIFDSTDACCGRNNEFLFDVVLDCSPQPPFLSQARIERLEFGRPIQVQIELASLLPVYKRDITEFVKGAIEDALTPLLKDENRFIPLFGGVSITELVNRIVALNIPKDASLVCPAPAPVDDEIIAQEIIEKKIPSLTEK